MFSRILFTSLSIGLTLLLGTTPLHADYKKGTFSDTFIGKRSVDSENEENGTEPKMGNTNLYAYARIMVEHDEGEFLQRDGTEFKALGRIKGIAPNDEYNGFWSMDLDAWHDHDYYPSAGGREKWDGSVDEEEEAKDKWTGNPKHLSLDRHLWQCTATASITGGNNLQYYDDNAMSAPHSEGAFAYADDFPLSDADAWDCTQCSNNEAIQTPCSQCDGEEDDDDEDENPIVSPPDDGISLPTDNTPNCPDCTAHCSPCNCSNSGTCNGTVSYHACGEHETSVSGDHTYGTYTCGIHSGYKCQESHDHKTYISSCTQTDANGNTCTNSSGYYECSQHTHTYPPSLVACGGASWTGCSDASSRTEHHVPLCSNGCGNGYWTCDSQAVYNHETSVSKTERIRSCEEKMWTNPIFCGIIKRHILEKDIQCLDS